MSTTSVAFALTGSFCTFQKVFDQMEKLVLLGYDILPVLSFHAANTDNRFFTSNQIKENIRRITGRNPIETLTDAEPIGPKKLADAYILAPATGASLAKFARGIFDTPALLGAKSHLRNGRPVLIAPSTNDGLSSAAENIGKILNMRNVYLVPFGQDDPVKKPRSLVADFEKIPQALTASLEGKQMQPILTCHQRKNEVK